MTPNRGYRLGTAERAQIVIGKQTEQAILNKTSRLTHTPTFCRTVLLRLQAADEVEDEGHTDPSVPISSPVTLFSF